MQVKCPNCGKLAAVEDSASVAVQAASVCPHCQSLLFMDQAAITAAESIEKHAGDARRTVTFDTGLTSRTKRTLVLFMVFVIAAVGYIYYTSFQEENLAAQALNSMAKTVLKQVILAQENYYLAADVYAADISELGPFFKKKPFVHIVIDQADGKTWAARVYHVKSPHWLIFDTAKGGFLGEFSKETQ